MVEQPESESWVAHAAIHMETLQKRVGIPARYRDCTFATYKPKNDTQEKALDFFRKVLKFETVFVTGPCGTGKTHLVCAYLNYRIMQGKMAMRFVNATDLLLRIKESYSSKVSEKEFIKEFLKSEVLVIDDIGAERITDNVKQLWYQIINERYNRMHPTIYTSNMGLQEIYDTHGERISSRLSHGDFIKVEGPDQRHRGKK